LQDNSQSLEKYNNFKKNFNYVLDKINFNELNHLINKLIHIRENSGRVFLAGMGGSAANASHATNDFRKICGINAICLTDNISEFSARINDEDQDEIFVNIIKIHEINQNDLVIILSVGGGSLENKTSINLVKLLEYAKSKSTNTCSFTGKSKCLAKQYSDIFIDFNLDNNKMITPLAESLQVYLWHFICTNEKLMLNKTKW
jgi:D-sedoheptulose 7-phosphate isomerase